MGASDHALTSIEICAGAGGQAIGLHQAGFNHLALVEIDQYAAATLERNIGSRDGWEFERQYCDILQKDVNEFKPLTELKKPVGYLGGPLKEKTLDLLAGGVPCPPFSHAGKQLGKDDERDLFPRMLDLVDELKPKAVMIENVRGIKDDKFQDYRDWVVARLEGGLARDPQTGEEVKYDGLYTVCGWEVLEASDFGVPQLRPRAILVAIRTDILGDVEFEWPVPKPGAVTVRAVIGASMEARFQKCMASGDDKRAAKAQKQLAVWQGQRDGIAPTLVGGSKKHGGADLGPSRAKAAWKLLGVNAMGVANATTDVEVKGSWERDLLRAEGPMLTVTQAAMIQGFPEEWDFAGDKKTEKTLPGKTAQYRQVGNAFPPPVAHAVGESIAKVLRAAHAAGRSGS